MSQDAPSLDDVLMAFAVEADTTGEALRKYLRDYPQYSEELVDLSREKFRLVCTDETEALPEDRMLIESAWRKITAGEESGIADPFAHLDKRQMRDLAQGLGLSNQVLTCLRERKVEAASIPSSILARLATLLDCTVERLNSYFMVPSTLQVARSYKAEQKPQNVTCVSFERLLIDAGVPEDKRARLLEGESR